MSVGDVISMLSAERAPIVFAGPSAADLPSWMAERIDLRPPAARGDLEALIAEAPPGRVVLIDGLFGASMAVSPTECRMLLEEGWQVLGASSMGALRASELWSMGMIGVGEIYTMLRLDVVTADAELAVCYHPDTFEEISVSLVHLRAVLAGLATRPSVAEATPALLAAARRLYWPERSRPALRRAWREEGISDPDVALVLERLADPRAHPKHNDARLAIRTALAASWVPLDPSPPSEL